MQTVYCSTPKGVRLNAEQLSALMSMPDQQFAEWLHTMSSIRRTFQVNRRMKERVDQTYGRFA